MKLGGSPQEAIARIIRDFAPRNEPRPFRPGMDPVPVSGKVYDAEELVAGCEAVLDGSWAGGRFTNAFEAELAKVCGVRHAILVNSGSSANLLALAALTAEELGDRRLKPGDEVVTCAAGFPTTVAPIVQLGMVPVFVDVEMGTYGPRIEQVNNSPVRAAMLAHALGNPCDFNRFAQGKEERFLIEDCCDALGSRYEPNGRWSPTDVKGNQRSTHVGNWSHLFTLSFYPAHQITCGEGGAVLTDSPRLNKIVRSLRDWGRDCWCDPGKDNTCGKRFDQRIEGMPADADHKYVYSRLGYNLKATEMQAAIGLAQLRKLPQFVEARRRNWQRLRDGLADLEHLFILPEATSGSKPAWFGFALTVLPEAPFSRQDIVQFLESRKIVTRPLFAGNLVRQPAFRGVNYRVVGDLANTDLVMANTFWVGCWPGLTEEMIDYVIESIRDFCKAAAR
ncbi:MAG: lipopolysaccharide biosynthesis protein RfbH [Patescibacteria group bacterium]|nr:lipopolysaccharide biosynthesis protein RfbH [Patescibacteria group bacterium]